MYSTCLFCHASLGANEVIEHFRVGRRLAFDPAKGRLWAVCARCMGWNLSPIEERWEALEECERRFRDARLRVSTDNIGLARLREGLELVRVGPALRPEFAAWRYGAKFRRRRTRTIIAGGVATAAFAGVAVLTHGTVVSFFGPAFGAAQHLLTRRTEVGHARRFLRSTMERATGRRWHGNNPASAVRIVASPEPEGWALRLSARSVLGERNIDFHGPDALRTAHVLLPAVNASGAGGADVDRAVREIEQVGDPLRYFAHVLERRGEWAQGQDGAYPTLASYPASVRLALEMAAHEETERRAMEGELALLEHAWREAEEVAAIADNLLVPPAVDELLKRAGRRDGGMTG